MCLGGNDRQGVISLVATPAMTFKALTWRYANVSILPSDTVLCEPKVHLVNSRTGSISPGKSLAALFTVSGAR